MMGFEHNDIDPDEYVTIQVIKVHLRKNLPILNPVIQRAVAESFSVDLKGAARSGEGQNEDFSKAALRYPWDGSVTAEICRVVGRVLMAWSGSMRTVGQHLTKLVDKRLEANANGTGGKYVDITHTYGEDFVLRRSKHIELANGSKALYWAILNLCIHREYIDILREEIQEVEQQTRSDPLKRLRLLDCFLRESARLNPPDALSVQRKAVKPFKLSDGTTVPAGNLVAVPQHAVMRDAEHYPDPDRFNPYRFYSPGDLDSDTAVQKFTDINIQYPFWGAPTKSCPGRWYASDVLKQILVYLLKNYEFELVCPANSEPLRLTTALAPRFGAQVRLRGRKGDAQRQT
ncbi:hypothetical protein DL765_007752 [Monosporascus sp. GIB2]|nr:hypothetical protein DL765_007752 [Monosporascus sp. GIB2]